MKDHLGKELSYKEENHGNYNGTLNSIAKGIKDTFGAPKKIQLETLIIGNLKMTKTEKDKVPGILDRLLELYYEDF